MELQLHSDSLFLLLQCKTNGIQYQMDSLVCSGLVGDDAVVIEIPNHGKIQYALPCMDVRDVRYPFPVRPVRMKLPVQQIPVLIDLLTHLQPFPAAADFRKQIILFHNPQHGFGITENVLSFQPQPHSPEP